MAAYIVGRPTDSVPALESCTDVYVLHVRVRVAVSKLGDGLSGIHSSCLAIAH